MGEQGHFGWVPVAVKLVVAGLGLLWVLSPSLPWLRRLPGDIRVERENVRFYFPLATFRRGGWDTQRRQLPPRRCAGPQCRIMPLPAGGDAREGRGTLLACPRGGVPVHVAA